MKEPSDELLSKGVVVFGLVLLLLAIGHAAYTYGKFFFE